MTSNMSKSQKMIAEGDRNVDRISNLPVDAIECILNCMPTLDAARTCVLSTRWRYSWANHPSLVLDDHFFHEIRLRRNPNQLVTDYPNIVNSILQLRSGHIRNFVIYVSAALNSMPHINIDTWLSDLCARGLRVLKITNRTRDTYKVPCSVFLSSDLSDLDLYFCTIRSQGFSKIRILKLHKVSFESCVVLTTPLLNFLGLHRCSGIINFDISALKLQKLLLSENDYFNLKPFLSCTGLLYAYLCKSEAAGYLEGRGRVCLVKLLAAWPRISTLIVNGFCFKYLAIGQIPRKLDQLKLRHLTFLDLSLDSKLMPWILCLLRNSPLLRALLVWFGNNGLNEESDKIDESRIVLDFQMNQLDYIILKGSSATRNDLVLPKILLRSAPVLKKIIVEEDVQLDAEERLRISKTLLYLQHAHPRLKIIFEPGMWESAYAPIKNSSRALYL